jgi:hypothetical protein
MNIALDVTGRAGSGIVDRRHCDESRTYLPPRGIRHLTVLTQTIELTPLAMLHRFRLRVQNAARCSYFFYAARHA